MNKRNVRCVLVSIGLIIVFCKALLEGKKCFDRICLENLKQTDKFSRYYLMYETWIELHQSEVSLSDYFKKEKLNKIAIYGYGKIGKNFYKEVKNSDIQVSYIIDRNADNFIEDIPVYLPKGNLPEVDAIIVTIPEQLSSIQRDLEKVCNYPVISLETVIYASSK